MSDVKFPAIEVRQPIGPFYVGQIDARQLFGMCRFDFRRIEERGGYKEFIGIQRRLDEKRVKEIKRYIDTVDAVFPTAVVLAVDARSVAVKELSSGIFNLTLGEYEDSNDPDSNISFDKIVSIIDGQHRIKAFEDYSGPEFLMNVAVFIDIDEATKAEIFSTVNLAQTKVNRSLVYDLFSFSVSRSPERTCHEITVALDRLEGSPFEARIKRLGTATPDRFGETLSQATVVRGILPYISNDPLHDRDIGKRGEEWEPIHSEREERRRIFYELFRRNEDEKILQNVLNFFGAVRARWPEDWANDGLGNMLVRTNGYNALIRFLRPAYLHFTSTPRVVSQAEFESLFAKVPLSIGAFQTSNFPPGSSGAKALFDILVSTSGVAAG